MTNKDYVRVASTYLLHECVDDLKCDYSVVYNIKASAEQKEVGISTIIDVIKLWLYGNTHITNSARNKLQCLLSIAEETPIFHIEYKQPDDISVNVIHEHITSYDLALSVYAGYVKEIISKDITAEVTLTIATIDDNYNRTDIIDLKYYTQQSVTD